MSLLKPTPLASEMSLLKPTPLEAWFGTELEPDPHFYQSVDCVLRLESKKATAEAKITCKGFRGHN
jgi:hypothetical protein